MGRTTGAYQVSCGTRRGLMAAFAACLLFTGGTARGEEGAASTPPVLKPGARLAIVGDSITEQKLYSRYIETYLLLCAPTTDLRVMQFGWGGERAAGFLGRMERDMMPFKPTVVTTCFGMNDGGYCALNEKTRTGYEQPMRDLVKRITEAGATVVVGSPGAVDTKFYHGGGEEPTVYNKTLEAFTEFDRKLAEENKLPFADVHTPMMETMAKAKAVLGESYPVCGGDGVHPPPNGHVVMAYAFLKGLGMQGDIGAITVDMKGAATATDGHKVISSQNGAVIVESARYPFCFFGDEKTPNSTRSILPFIPFNKELNRLTLVVKNLSAPKAKITWGKTSKVFDREALEKGVNLADEFIDNPFCEQFQKMEQLIAAKQSFETMLIKTFNGSLPQLCKELSDWPEAALLGPKLWNRQEKYSADVAAAKVPVTHTVQITPEG